MKSGKKNQDPVTKHGKWTPKQLEHQYKLSLVRDCQIYGKSYEVAKTYFKSKGFSLGHSQFAELKNELKTKKSAKEWFSKEALYVIEEDHMISVERIRGIEDKLVEEMYKLISDDDFTTEVSYTTNNEGIVNLRVKNYNLELFMKLAAQFQSIQETKTKMFSATPLVQEVMEVHARQEEESQQPKKVKQPVTH